MWATTLPAGTTALGEGVTSGTSGVRLKVPQTNVVHLWWSAFYLRDLEWCGIDPRGTLAGIVTTGKTGKDLEAALRGVPSNVWLNQLAELIVTGPSHGMDVQQDHQQQLDWLRLVNPDYFVTYPSNLAVLTSLVREEGERLPRLRKMQVVAEPLSDTLKAEAEAVFGVPVLNIYSCTEAGYLASECPQGHGLHVHAEGVLLEVLDGAGQPCPPGQPGRVVMTTLNNLRAPFIRYEIGDEVVLGPQPCPCGRGLPLLTSVTGKQRPMLHLADGRRKSSSPLVAALHKIGGYRQYQVIQKAVNRVVVRLAIDATWTPGHGEKIRGWLRAYLEGPIQVDIQVEERLLPSARGKLQGIVCELGR